MTFDGPTNSTWGEAFAQLRDKISGMTNWSIKDDSTDGATSFGQSDYTVFTTPTGEDARIRVGSFGQFILETGPNWDTANTTWGDQYSQTFECYPMPEKYDDEYNMQMSDQVRWWAEYVDDKGWAFVATREEGDGNDKGCAVGMAQLTKLWDYTTAQVREGDYSFLCLGVKPEYDETTNNEFSHTAEGGGSSGTYHGKGEVNADGNNDNYPMVETTLQASSKYEDALIGEHDLWIQDNSGDRSAHLDTVTDGGADKFTIFKEGLPSPVGIRMD